MDPGWRDALHNAPATRALTADGQPPRPAPRTRARHHAAAINGAQHHPVASIARGRVARGIGALEAIFGTGRVPAGGGLARHPVDDKSNTVRNDTSIAIGPDGLPVISHFDATGGALRLVKCGTRSCQ